jgi:ADP-ribose pyrophosphatase YjhB (NUDIX family)
MYWIFVKVMLMNTIVINDNNLNENDVHKYGNKVRAILLSKDKILVANYGGVVLLPGGSIDIDETIDDAIIRELLEETGYMYDLKELEQVFTIKHYQYNYPTRYDEVVNRLLTTHYYFGHFNEININNIRRTEKENKDNFSLHLIDIDDLLLQNEDSNNPRKIFFDRENEEVVKLLKRTKF